MSSMVKNLIKKLIAKDVEIAALKAEIQKHKGSIDCLMGKFESSTNGHYLIGYGRTYEQQERVTALALEAF